MNALSLLISALALRGALNELSERKQGWYLTVELLELVDKCSDELLEEKVVVLPDC